MTTDRASGQRCGKGKLLLPPSLSCSQPYLIASFGAIYVLRPLLRVQTCLKNVWAAAPSHKARFALQEPTQHPVFASGERLPGDFLPLTFSGEEHQGPKRTFEDRANIPSVSLAGAEPAGRPSHLAPSEPRGGPRTAGAQGTAALAAQQPFPKAGTKCN